MKSKKAQVGIIGAIFLFLFFLIMWFIWLGSWLADIGSRIVIEHSLTGIEAFFFTNLNFVVMIALFLGMMGWIYFGG